MIGRVGQVIQILPAFLFSDDVKRVNRQLPVAKVGLIEDSG